jgi:processive 1,2-diacylglycerol beta-glucosyltransferase
MGLSAEALDLFDLAPRWATRPYLFTHFTGQNRAPELYGKGFHATNARGGALEPVRLKLDQVLFSRLRARVRELAPRAIVATHHLPLVVLGRERRKGRLAAEVTCVVTDYVAHACWVERGVDWFCVPSLHPRNGLVRHGVDPGRVVMTGIPVREGFERAAAVRTPPNGEPLRVLVTSGGFGVGPMVDVVRSFGGVRDVALTVVCGAAEEVEREVRAEVARLGLRAEVVGFERDMPARVAAAHVVVGKAGGLTVTETLTAGRPMVVVGAVPGNEKLNEHFVVGGGAGIAVQPDQAGAAVAAMRQMGVIEAMGARARALVVRGAGRRVVLTALSVGARVAA